MLKIIMEYIVACNAVYEVNKCSREIINNSFTHW